MSEIRSGDLLWHMCGTRQNDKIKWEAEPRVIEKIDTRMVRFYRGGMISLNSIGKTNFTSKEECEKNWLEKHASFTEAISFEETTPDGVDELPRTDWETFEVNRFDGVDSCAVYKGGLGRLVNVTNALKWHRDTEHVGEYGMEIEYLELHEISEQMEYRGLLTVFINSPMKSKVFQYGNYPDAGWVFLGNIQGYA